MRLSERHVSGFAFANVEAATEFEEQRARFFAEHERRDDYLEMREGLDVGNFREEQVVACGDSLPWLHSAPVFWLCSLLLLSWPLRLFQQCRTAYVHYEVNCLCLNCSGACLQTHALSQCQVPFLSQSTVFLTFTF